MSGTEDVRCARKGDFLTQWDIQYLSMFVNSANNFIKSDTFVVPFLGNTQWYLKLLSKGASESHIMCFLCRGDDGPDNIKAIYSMSVDSSYVVESQLFAKDSSCFTPGLIDLKKFNDDVESGASKDVLRVECRIRPDNCAELLTLASPYPVGIVMSTKIAKETRSMHYKIPSFSNWQDSMKVEFDVPTAKSSLNKIGCKLWMDQETLKLLVSVSHGSQNQFLLKCKAHLLDAFGDRCPLQGDGPVIGLPSEISDTRNTIPVIVCKPSTFSLALTKKQLMEEMDRYLPNDELLLHLEFAFAFNESWNNVEKTLLNESFDLQANRKVKWGVYLDRKYNDHRLFFRLLALVVVVLSVLPHLLLDNTL